MTILEIPIYEDIIDISDLLNRFSDAVALASKNSGVVSGRIETKKPEKKLRPCQIHRKRCREMAKELWEEDPTLTIVDMAYKDEINSFFNGKTYTVKTIRGWIKDLCPNRSPGRRPKKKNNVKIPPLKI